MKSTGKGAVILPRGVLFRGNVEGQIRKQIVSKGLIKGIIGLPPNLFYGTGIPACIIVLDKEHAAERTGIFMINAGKGFMKDGNKNRLLSQDIHKIVDTFNKQLEIDKYFRLVPLDEISDPRNDYNLNIPRYIFAKGCPVSVGQHVNYLSSLGKFPNANFDQQNLIPVNVAYWQMRVIRFWNRLFGKPPL